MTLRVRLNLAFALLSVFALFTSGIITQSQTAFADDDKKGKNQKTLESECSKKKGNGFDGLLCRAVIGLQNQIDSFFDIFVELADVVNFGCPQGQVAIGTNADGGLICGADPGNDALDQRLDDLEARIAALEEDQPTCPNNCSNHGTCSNGQCACDSGFTGSDCSTPQEGQCIPSIEVCDGVDNDCDGVVDDQITGVGISCLTGNVGVCSIGTSSCINGQIICSPTVLPGGAEICSDGLDNNCNGIVDDNCTPTLCVDGQPVPNQVSGDCQVLVCQNGQIVSTTDSADIPSSNQCAQGQCVGGTPQLAFSAAGTACDDGNISTVGDVCDGAGSCVGTSSFSGLYSITPAVNYQCALGLVDIDTSQITVNHNTANNMVQVSGIQTLLIGSATQSGFSADATSQSDDCSMQIQMNANYVDTNTFSGTLTLDFVGQLCGILSCSNQNFEFIGSR